MCHAGPVKRVCRPTPIGHFRRMRISPTPRRLFVLAATLLMSAPLVRAQEMTKPVAPATAVHFAKLDQIDVAAVLPDPPAAGSLAANADLETVLQVQAARTPEQVAWAHVVERNDLFEVFGAGGLLGAHFTKENFPLLVALIKDVNDDLRPMVDASKKRYARPRPYAVDAQRAAQLAPVLQGLVQAMLRWRPTHA